MNIGGPAWRELTSDELRLLSTIGYQVGVAVERARLAEASTRLACMEDRTRLAREIHDTLAQGLTAIGLHVEGAMALLTRDPERARQRLERALDTCRVSLEEARRSVQELRAAPLDGKPLPEALAALARWFATETGVRARLTAPDTLPSLPPSVEAEVFRVAQEALTNVRRHAHATEVVMTLGLTRGRLRLTLRDNGQGFETGTVSAHCQGLLGMRERARLLGGRLRISSRPGEGTMILLEAPLPVAPETAGEGEAAP
jgi:two-component system NarL family sensor kinase